MLKWWCIKGVISNYAIPLFMLSNPSLVLLNRKGYGSGVLSTKKPCLCGVDWLTVLTTVCGNHLS